VILPLVEEPVASPPPHGIAYRADIDGLRALAVLPIVFNHASLRGFGGGYVGVDIFFVISGYLITGILLRDMATHRHTLAAFYRRRILRIMPALIAMLVPVTALCLVALLPGELIRYAKSLIATVLFGSNFVFNAESGYFEGASHTKPLLHTWSLAIEEQFYILWPLLLALVAGRGRIVIAAAMAAISAASLAVASCQLRVDPTAAFYLLPARAGELAIGGLLAVAPGLRRMRWLREAAGAIGLLLIGYAIWKFSASTPFPGFSALVPCLGTALLIGSGPDTLAGRGLAIAPARYVGRISYSLYLWHWPVIVLAQTWLIVPMAGWVAAGAVSGSLVLGALSYHLVETPFRRGSRTWSNRTIFLGAGAAIGSIAAMGAALIATHGLPARFTTGEVAMAHFKDVDFEASFRRGECFLTNPYDKLAPGCLRIAPGKPAVLLIGDSMAAHYWPGLSAYGRRFQTLQATVAGCTPGLYPGPSSRCERFYNGVLADWLPRSDVKTVIMGGRWQAFDMPSLDLTLGYLTNRGVRVILVGPPPTYQGDLPRLLVFAERRHDPGIVTRSHEEQFFEVDAAMRAIAARRGVTYVSLTGAWCRGGQCLTRTPDGAPLQFDYGHLTPQGSALAAKLIVSALPAR
jgi:peptidoglycan/LPS O-acetylase OafA/YrhL